ncbi:MAG TPA: ABC transporter ATP-binding protein [Nitrososphaerales archaeon]|nr:ABC transporter ATP-binding protein [Nitrososphaerales archaeon]
MTDSLDASIQALNLGKRYGSGPTSTIALQNVNFKVEKGEFVSIIGPSGSGKTTLLNLLGALDRPTTGKVFIDGMDISKLPNAELAKVRNKKLGFVFQDFNLISRMSAGENVELPLLIEGVTGDERRRRATVLLDKFGLGSKSDRNVNKLSGGERQRVAVARALANDPDIILADEPTGNLDTKNTEVMMEFMRQLNVEFGKTVLIITHNPEVAKRARRLISIKDGQIEREELLN